MPKLTATERLRRLLDERGVEWADDSDAHSRRTWWRVDGVTYTAVEVCDKLRVGAYFQTPEQAIDATLGRGTCHAVFEVDAMSEDERVGEYVCSECGETFNAGHGEFPRYCPNCGARVVE